MSMGGKNTKPDDDHAAAPISEPPTPPYVPLESLTEQTVYSIISVVNQCEGLTINYSERTLLIFLLTINDKLKEIENRTNDAEKAFDDNLIEHAKKVRQWLVDKKKNPLNWDELHKMLDHMKKENRYSLEHYYGVQDPRPYFELTMNTKFNDVKQSRDYIKKFRQDGFMPEELVVYWNTEQLENLCPKQEEKPENLPSHDPSDTVAIQNLREYPVPNRNYECKISYINKGIEKAVFDIPENAQIIVLNFANEQSPGGGYLRHAMAQEEVILYNSDGYRALLDLKYKRMGGGYAIPEFGLAYVRNIRFFDSKNPEKGRSTDMMVSACYCLNGDQLYANPRSKEQLMENNVTKFRAFMSAAVANTVGDGSNTYLLLGPIGTGAFGNDVDDIGECFRRVLEMPMMNSTGPVRNCFGNIWFVSIDKWKNEHFEQIFNGKKPKAAE